MKLLMDLEYSVSLSAIKYQKHSNGHGNNNLKKTNIDACDIHIYGTESDNADSWPLISIMAAQFTNSEIHATNTKYQICN